MIAMWMLYSIAIGCLLFVAALVLEGVARALVLPTRFAWGIAFAAMTVMPGVAWNTDARREPETTPVVYRAATRRDASVATAAPAAFSGWPARAIASADERIDLARLNRPLTLLLVAAPITTLAFFLLTLARLRRLTRSLEEGTVDGQRVLLSDNLGPAVLGVIDARVVVPRWLLEMTPLDRQLVLSHERQHAEAHDPAMLAGGMVLLALQPWNPIAWMMLARLRFAIEADCDARVLRRHGDERRYASLLVGVYERSRRRSAWSMAFDGGTSKLERRVRRILARGARPTNRRLIGSVGIAGAVVLAACEMPAPDATSNTRAPSVSIVGLQPECMRFTGEWRQQFDRVQRIVRERRPEIATRRATEELVVGLVLDENCGVVRDTVLARPPGLVNGQLFSVALPDVPVSPKNVSFMFDRGSGSSRPVTIAYAVIPSKAFAARRARDECGFGIRSDELCSVHGPVVIRMVDSVRALIAVRAIDAPTDAAQHVFLVTLSRPSSELATQRLAHAAVSYHAGAIYVEDMISRDGPILFAVERSGLLERSRSQYRKDLRKIDSVIGVAHYGAGLFTLAQIEQLRPSRKCDGLPGACYEVGGRVIEFPV